MSQMSKLQKNLDDTPNFQELLENHFSKQPDREKKDQSNVPPPAQDELAPPITLGICGGHSSGKVIFSGLLKHKLKSNKNQYDENYPTINVEIIKQEKYNLIPKDDINRQEEQYEYIDWKKMNDDFDKLVLVNDVVIVEGTLILTNEDLRKKLKIKIFLDTDEDVRLSRIVYKEVCKRHKDVRQVIENYLIYQKTVFEKVVLPSQKHAEIVIPNFGDGFPTDINYNLPTEIGGYRNINNPALFLIANNIKQLIYMKKKENESELGSQELGEGQNKELGEGQNKEQQQVQLQQEENKEQEQIKKQNQNQQGNDSPQFQNENNSSGL